jgi:hypothetical protein
VNRRGFFRLLASVSVAIAAKPTLSAPSFISVPSYTAGAARFLEFGTRDHATLHGSEAVIPTHNLASGITVRFNADMRPFNSAIRNAQTRFIDAFEAAKR